MMGKLLKFERPPKKIKGLKLFAKIDDSPILGLAMYHGYIYVCTQNGVFKFDSKGNKKEITDIS